MRHVSLMEALGGVKTPLTPPTQARKVECLGMDRPKDERRQTATDIMLARILEVLDQGPATATSIAAQLGIRAPRTSVLLAILRDRGDIVRTAQRVLHHAYIYERKAK